MARKRIEIRMDLAALIAEVQNETWLRARAARTEDTVRRSAVTTATDDEPESARVLRSVQRAMHQVEGVLHEYCDITRRETDNERIDMGDNEMTYALDMPTNYDEAGTSALTEAIHEYLADVATADWYAANGLEADATYAAGAAEAMKEIRRAASLRKMPSPISRKTTKNR